jgi:predicted tellurium resistance membrane protein TerC
MVLDLADVLTPAGLTALLSVVLIDLTMAGDNVVVMGTIASGLPERERRRVIMVGVAMALIFLIGFALTATWLLQLTGLLLAGQ